MCQNCLTTCGMNPTNYFIYIFPFHSNATWFFSW